MNDVTEQTCPINNLEAGHSSFHSSGIEANKQGDETKHPHGSDRRYQTLSRIAAYLESYMSHDEIDEDSILSLISKLEESRSLRYRMKNIINAKTQSLTNTPIHDISDCEYKSDVENPVSYNEGSKFKSISSIVKKAYESHIDGDFFFDIIDDIEKDNEDFLLDDETISSLRQSLMITNNGKKRKRRNLKLSISPHDSVFDQDDCFEISSTSSRPKRGTLRGREHGSHLEEYDNIHHLLSAMVDSETKNGRSIDLVSDIHQELSLKRRLRKRKKKNTALETRDYDIVKSSNRKTKSSTSPKSKGRNKKKQDKNHMLSSSRKLQKDDATSQVNILKESKHDFAFQKSTEYHRLVLNEVEDPILEWMLLEDRWNLNRLILEPIRTRHEDSIYGNFSCNLLNSLKGKSRLFARYEFFYSDIDKSWFNENPFHKELISSGISPTTPFKRKEWSAIRRKITKGPPRRFSRKFIDNEFEQLNRYRRRVRTIQKLHLMGEPIHPVTDFEYEVLAPSKVGSMVTAYCHKVHLLHRGIVLSHDYNTGSYLIQFEKKSLGHAWCPDFEVSSHGLQEVIDTGMKNYLHLENFHSSSISRFGKLAQETSFGFIADSLTGMSGIRNAKKTGGHHALVSPSSLSRHMDYFKEISDKIYEQDALALCMTLIDSLIERKEVLLNSIDCINKEISANSPDNQSTSSILQHFDWLIQNHKKTEGALQTALVYLKIIYGKAFDGNTLIPTPEQQKSTNCSRNLVEASDISEELKHAIESCTSELRSKLQSNLADNENDHQIMDFATYLLAALSILSDTDDGKSIVDLKTLQETLNFHLDPLRPSTSHRGCIPEIIQEAVRLQNESFKLLNTSVDIFLTQINRKMT